MSINSKSPHFYWLDNHLFQQVSESPYLGVKLSEDLTWGSHISKITKNLGKLYPGISQTQPQVLPTFLQENSIQYVR